MRAVEFERSGKIRLTGSHDGDGHGVWVNGPEARDPQAAEVVQEGDAVELAILGHVPLVTGSVVILAVNMDLALLHVRDGVDLVVLGGHDVGNVQATVTVAILAADGADLVLEPACGDVVELAHRGLGIHGAHTLGERTVKLLAEVTPGVGLLVAGLGGAGRRADGGEGLEGTEVAGQLWEGVDDMDGAVLCWSMMRLAVWSKTGGMYWMVVQSLM